jgi:hypothetical protein
VHACQQHSGKISNGLVFPSDVGEDKAFIDIEFDYQTNLMPFDSLFDDIFFVKLETTDNSLIGQISQILFTSDRIIVVDRFVANAVTVFDQSGKFLNTIGNFGQAPHEYTYLGQVCLTPDKTMLVIYDTSMKYYTLDSEFVKSQRTTPYIFSHIEFLNNKTIATVATCGNIVDKNDASYRPSFIVLDADTKNIHYSAFHSL